MPLLIKTPSEKLFVALGVFEKAKSAITRAVQDCKDEKARLIEEFHSIEMKITTLGKHVERGEKALAGVERLLNGGE